MKKIISIVIASIFIASAAMATNECSDEVRRHIRALQSDLDPQEFGQSVQKIKSHVKGVIMFKAPGKPLQKTRVVGDYKAGESNIRVEEVLSSAEAAINKTPSKFLIPIICESLSLPNETKKPFDLVVTKTRNFVNGYFGNFLALFFETSRSGSILDVHESRSSVEQVTVKRRANQARVSGTYKKDKAVGRFYLDVKSLNDIPLGG